MASIKQRGTGWCVRWRDPDGSAHRHLLPDYKAALQFKREVERRVALLQPGIPERSGDTSLQEVIDEYLRVRQRLWRPNTYENNDVSLSLFQEWLGTTLRKKAPTVQILSRSTLEDFAQHLREHRRCIDSTVSVRVSCILGMWRWASDSDAFGNVVPQPKKPAIRERSNEETIAPTWDQMDAVIAEAPSEHWRRLLIVLRCTGLRKRQAMGLWWADVDLPAGTLYVRPELGKSKQERRGRWVPLAPVLLTELRTWERNTEYLIDWPGIRKAHNIVCERAWTRAGVAERVWKKRTLHAFRKGFVSGLKRLNADAEAVERLVGHSLGIRGVYTSDDAMDLAAVVRLVPAVASVLPLARPAAA